MNSKNDSKHNNQQLNLKKKQTKNELSKQLEQEQNRGNVEAKELISMTHGHEL